MTQYLLKVTLASDTTFGRGDGVAGLVDVEVQYDQVGLPYLRGRTLKGLLAAECADIVFALQHGGNDPDKRWDTVAARLFGLRGAHLDGVGQLHVGPARLPAELQSALAYEVVEARAAPGEGLSGRTGGDLTRADVLDTLTAVRRQTAMDESGAPRRETLRAYRVILRGITFTSKVSFARQPEDDELALLAATVKALRRLGSGRNRGRGKVTTCLCAATGEDVTDQHFATFKQEVNA